MRRSLAKRQADARWNQKRRTQKEHNSRYHAGRVYETDTPAPSFQQRGECSRPWNLRVVDAAFSGHGHTVMKEKVCGPCPVRDACRAYVQKAEEPAGSWGGVWGGLTPEERRRA